MCKHVFFSSSSPDFSLSRSEALGILVMEARVRLIYELKKKKAVKAHICPSELSRPRKAPHHSLCLSVASSLESMFLNFLNFSRTSCNGERDAEQRRRIWWNFRSRFIYSARARLEQVGQPMIQMWTQNEMKYSNKHGPHASKQN